MLNYIDAMKYFHSIAPITQSDAIQYAINYAFLFILGTIPITLIISYGLFLHEVRILKEKYHENAPFTFQEFMLRGDTLLPVVLIIVIGVLATAINTYHTKYYLDNLISKKEVVESSYFDSLDANSRQFVKNYLLLNDETTIEYPPLSLPYVYKLGELDSSKINVKSFLPNINIQDLEKLIKYEIEYRKFLQNERESSENGKQEIIKYIQDIKNAK
jgi:hypothetical protein